MASVVKKNFSTPDDTMKPAKAEVQVCNIGDVAAAKLTLQPGWSWSECIKPSVGGDSCQKRHIGTVISGSMGVKHDDGTEQVFTAGDVYLIEPGHDGWTVGDEPCVVHEFNSTWIQDLRT